MFGMNLREQNSNEVNSISKYLANEFTSRRRSTFLTIPQGKETEVKSDSHGDNDFCNSSCRSKNDVSIDKTVCVTYKYTLRLNDENSESVKSNSETYFQTLTSKAGTLFENGDDKKTLSQKNKATFNSRKRRGLYEHQLWKEEDGEMKAPKARQKRTAKDSDIFTVNPDETKLIRTISYLKPFCKSPLIKVKCSKKMKNLYTVVKETRQPDQCHEVGEIQDKNDDISYLLEGMNTTNNYDTRCLSILQMVTKCLNIDFLDHVYKGEYVPQIISALKDAHENEDLALCTSLLLFILSKHNLFLEKSSDIMCQVYYLVKNDSHFSTTHMPLTDSCDSNNKPSEKHKSKVMQLYSSMTSSTLSDISVSALSLKALLNFTSRSITGKIIRDMISSGIIALINDKVIEGVESLLRDEDCNFAEDLYYSRLSFLYTCLKIIESLTFDDYEIQVYLCNYRGQELLRTYSCLLKIFVSQLNNFLSTSDASNLKEKFQSLLLPFMLSVFKTLVDITYNDADTSKIVGTQEGMIENLLTCVLDAPGSIPQEYHFEFLVLTLGLLLNILFENKSHIRHLADVCFMDHKEKQDKKESPLNLLIKVCLERMDAARLAEVEVYKVLNCNDVKENILQKSFSFIELAGETSENNAVLECANKHMEHTVLCAYSLMLLGFLIQCEKKSTHHWDCGTYIKSLLSPEQMKDILDVLKKFSAFSTLIDPRNSWSIHSLQSVIKTFEKL